jgi:hypothetical protein
MKTWRESLVNKRRVVREVILRAKSVCVTCILEGRIVKVCTFIKDNLFQVTLLLIC